MNKKRPLAAETLMDEELGDTMRRQLLKGVNCQPKIITAFGINFRRGYRDLSNPEKSDKQADLLSQRSPSGNIQSV